MNRLEYMYFISPKNRNLIFMILVEGGYRKETGFALLEKMRTAFGEMFTDDRIERAKEYSLSKEFRGEMKALIEVFSADSYDKTDEAIKVVD